MNLSFIANNSAAMAGSAIDAKRRPSKRYSPFFCVYFSINRTILGRNINVFWYKSDSSSLSAKLSRLASSECMSESSRSISESCEKTAASASASRAKDSGVGSGIGSCAVGRPLHQRPAQSWGSGSGRTT